MNTITIYSTASCGFCRMLKRFLDDHKISYVTKMADEDQAIAQELFEKSGQLGVPFSIITDQDGNQVDTMLGFDAQKINGLIQDGTLAPTK